MNPQQESNRAVGDIINRRVRGAEAQQALAIARLRQEASEKTDNIEQTANVMKEVSGIIDGSTLGLFLTKSMGEKFYKTIKNTIGKGKKVVNNGKRNRTGEFRDDEVTKPDSQTAIERNADIEQAEADGFAEADIGEQVESRGIDRAPNFLSRIFGALRKKPDQSIPRGRSGEADLGGQELTGEVRGGGADEPLNLLEGEPPRILPDTLPTEGQDVADLSGTIRNEGLIDRSARIPEQVDGGSETWRNLTDEVSDGLDELRATRGSKYDSRAWEGYNQQPDEEPLDLGGSERAETKQPEEEDVEEFDDDFFTRPTMGETKTSEPSSITDAYYKREGDRLFNEEEGEAGDGGDFFDRIFAEQKEEPNEPDYFDTKIAPEPTEYKPTMVDMSGEGGVEYKPTMVDMSGEGGAEAIEQKATTTGNAEINTIRDANAEARAKASETVDMGESEAGGEEGGSFLDDMGEALGLGGEEAGAEEAGATIAGIGVDTAVEAGVGVADVALSAIPFVGEAALVATGIGAGALAIFDSIKAHAPSQNPNIQLDKNIRSVQAQYSATPVNLAGQYVAPSNQQTIQSQSSGGSEGF